jgi:NTE family protein/lysophospholipid hydrolase
MTNITLEQIIQFLKSTSLFGGFNGETLKQLAKFLNIVSLQGGQVLIRQNTVGESLYIVESGRLRATIQDKEHQDIFIGEIGRGEIVGEIAIFVGTPRTATVSAIRDSVLLELKQDAFESFSKVFPEAAIAIAKFCVKRLINKKIAQTSPAATIVFVPPNKDSLFSNFIREISTKLGKIEPTFHLNQEIFNRQFGTGAAQTLFESDDNNKIVSWLQDLEIKYRYIIYEADAEFSQWTLRCLRQADRVILINEFSEDPRPNRTEQAIEEVINRTHVKVDLALLHKNDMLPLLTSRWLNLRVVDDHHHIRLSHQADYDKFVRFITGRRLNLVLAGGGAPAFSYVGFFKAVEEAKISFDYVGGNSAGAYMAGLYAVGMKHDEMMDIIINGIERYRFFQNYTLPILSLFNGKSLYDNLYRAFLDKNIEDLWTKYFCVSCNLSKHGLDVYRRGLLWKAVRASLSLPGIFPPVIDESGHLHVDGGLMNNLPVDIMRRSVSSGKIVAVKFSHDAATVYTPQNVVVSGWRLFFDSLLKTRKNKIISPHIVDVMVSSMTLSSSLHSEQMIKEADYCISINLDNMGMLQLKNIKELIDFSYDYFVKKIEEINFFSQDLRD